MSEGAAPFTAVIAAAGSGERLGAGGPKALVELSGRPMVAWAVAAFAAAGAEAIVVAAPPGGEPALERAVGASEAKSTRVVEGGATRSRSVRRALAAVETDLVAIHDAARPLVTAKLIRGVLEALAGDPEAAGAIAACPVVDTIKRVAPADRLRTHEGEAPAGSSLAVEKTLDRGSLWAAQTPQAFRVAALRAALEGGEEALDAATDEAMVVEGNGGRVLVHPAPPENLKVTTPLDLRVAEQLLGVR